MMLVSAKDLQDRTVHATDGSIGKVVDLYFDDEEWVARYLVVDTGGWLSSRKVLISPYSVRGAFDGGDGIDVNLTREQVRESPPFDSATPVSRDYEHLLAQHYSYNPYWTGAHLWGLGAYPAMAVQVPPPEYLRDRADPIAQEMRERAARDRAPEDTHLRSADDVMGHEIRATDGSIGHADDLFLEPRTWAIRCMVIDTRTWLPGKQVLVAPEWIARVNWPLRSVDVNLSRHAIREAPAYERGQDSRAIDASLQWQQVRSHQPHA